ncbi:MAG: hypothetical protein L0229_00055 [Blastocatellia bacterium]|nr:hypothetical protein [Blastocatellia bacterium]
MPCDARSIKQQRTKDDGPLTGSSLPGDDRRPSALIGWRLARAPDFFLLARGPPLNLLTRGLAFR